MVLNSREDSERRIALEREFQLIEVGYSGEVYLEFLQASKMKSFAPIVEG